MVSKATVAMNARSDEKVFKRIRPKFSAGYLHCACFLLYCQGLSEESYKFIAIGDEGESKQIDF